MYYSQATLSMDSYEQCNFPLFNPKRDSIGRMLITRTFLRAFSECEGMYTQHMASHCGHWLSADHTFKVSANIGYWSNQKWIKLYNAVFIVMNEENKYLHGNLQEVPLLIQCSRFSLDYIKDIKMHNKR